MLSAIVHFERQTAFISLLLPIAVLNCRRVPSAQEKNWHKPFLVGLRAYLVELPSRLPPQRIVIFTNLKRCLLAAMRENCVDRPSKLFLL